MKIKGKFKVKKVTKVPKRNGGTEEEKWRWLTPQKK